MIHQVEYRFPNPVSIVDVPTYGRCFVRDNVDVADKIRNAALKSSRVATKLLNGFVHFEDLDLGSILHRSTIQNKQHRRRQNLEIIQHIQR